MLFEVSNSKKAVIRDVLHVPKLFFILFSVRAAVKRGNTVKFGQLRCLLRGPTGSLQGMGFVAGKLYHLKCKVIIDEESASMGLKDLPQVNRMA